MSFKENDNQQITPHDSFLNLSPRVKKIVENSWCSDFADTVFPAINEEAFSVLCSIDPASRPNTPVNLITKGDDALLMQAGRLLGCSRQNIDDLMRRDKLHPLRKDAKYKLFSRAEVENSRRE